MAVVEYFASSSVFLHLFAPLKPNTYTADANNTLVGYQINVGQLTVGIMYSTWRFKLRLSQLCSVLRFVYTK